MVWLMLCLIWCCLQGEEAERQRHARLRAHPFFMMDVVLQEGRDLVIRDSCGEEKGMTQIRPHQSDSWWPLWENIMNMLTSKKEIKFWKYTVIYTCTIVHVHTALTYIKTISLYIIQEYMLFLDFSFIYIITYIITYWNLKLQRKVAVYANQEVMKVNFIGNCSPQNKWLYYYGLHHSWGHGQNKKSWALSLHGN